MTLSFGVRVGCGHVVRWTDGRLQAPGHHGDGEQALLALGGGFPACSTLLSAWSAVRRFAAHGPIELASQLLAGAPGPHALSSAHAAAARGAADESGVVLDRALREAASDRQLVDLVAALPPLWRAAAIAELAEARAGWLLVPSGRADDAAKLALLRTATDLASAAIGQPVVVDPWSSGEVRSDGTIVVGWTWLARVWFPGLALVDGRPCVAVGALGDEVVARVAVEGRVTSRILGPAAAVAS